jgi:hypothetical protein
VKQVCRWRLIHVGRRNSISVVPWKTTRSHTQKTIEKLVPGNYPEQRQTRKMVEKFRFKIEKKHRIAKYPAIKQNPWKQVANMWNEDRPDMTLGPTVHGK